jgi:hypothetical protein
MAMNQPDRVVNRRYTLREQPFLLQMFGQVTNRNAMGGVEQARTALDALAKLL